jgi:hypothetical protein
VEVFPAFGQAAPAFTAASAKDKELVERRVAMDKTRIDFFISELYAKWLRLLGI